MLATIIYSEVDRNPVRHVVIRKLRWCRWWFRVDYEIVTLSNLSDPNGDTLDAFTMFCSGGRLEDNLKEVETVLSLMSNPPQPLYRIKGVHAIPTPSTRGKEYQFPCIIPKGDKVTYSTLVVFIPNETEVTYKEKDNTLVCTEDSLVKILQELKIIKPDTDLFLNVAHAQKSWETSYAILDAEHELHHYWGQL